MFARFTRFYLGAADEEQFRKVSDRFLPILKEQPGCQSVVWVQGEGESAVFSTWDSRENAEAVTTAVRDKAVAALQEASVVLAQAPENITVVEVLRIVQHQPHGGPQAFAVGTDNISQVLMRRDAAVEAALGGLTLRNLIRDPPVASELDAAWEPPPEMNLDPAPRSESVRDIPGNPDSLQKKIQADLPAEGH